MGTFLGFLGKKKKRRYAIAQNMRQTKKKKNAFLLPPLVGQYRQHLNV